MLFRITFFTLMICAMSSCVKQEAGQFQLEYRFPLTIPANASPIANNHFVKNLNSGWNQFLTAHNLKQSDIKMVTTKSVILSPELEKKISYDLISDGEVYLYPLNNPTQLTGIALVNDPPANTNEMGFIPGSVSVTDIISQSAFGVRMDLHIKVTPGFDSDHYLTIQFYVFLN